MTQNGTRISSWSGNSAIVHYIKTTSDTPPNPSWPADVRHVCQIMLAVVPAFPLRRVADVACRFRRRGK